MTRPILWQKVVTGGIGTAVLLTVIGAWLTYQQISALIETMRFVAHTHEALMTMEVLLSNFVEADNAHRGYVIAGGGRYLELYNAAGKEVGHTLERLRPLTSANPHQQQRLGMLNAIFHESIAQWQHSIEIQDDVEFHPETQIMLTGREQDLLQKSHWVIETMKAEEESQLKRHQELVQGSSHGVYATILSLSGFNVGLLSLLLFLVIRDNAAGGQSIPSPDAHPPELPQHDSSHRAPAHSKLPLAARLPLHILVADDNLVNQKAAQHLLSQLGYQADLVGNGREVVAALDRQYYDVVLLDVQMPELDGLETARLIHLRPPIGIRPRLIAMTANDTPEGREACMRAGMDDYLAKPLYLETLEAALIRWGESLMLPGNIRLPSGSGDDEFAALIQLRALQPEGEPDIVTELIDLFLEDTPPRIETLHQAVQDSASPALEQTGHSLKGSCAMIGAERMAELCAELESLGRANTLSDADRVLTALEFEFTRVRDVLVRMRQAT